MSQFVVRGSYKAGLIGDVWQSFTKTVESQNAKNAENKVYSLIGSEHGIKRNLIRIDEVNGVE